MKKGKKIPVKLINKLVESKIQERFERIKDFKKKIDASILLHHGLREHNYKLYFRKTLINSGTPDLFAENLNDSYFLIGDLKLNLPRCPTETFKKEDKKKYEKINKQLKKYNCDLGYKPHQDVFLLSNGLNIDDRKDYLKKEYIDKNVHLSKNFIFLNYEISKGEGINLFKIRKDYGNFKDPKLNQIFENNKSLKLKEDKITEIMTREKLFQVEDNCVPTEYLMFILRIYIFPELIENNRIENIVRSQNENKFFIRINMGEVATILRDMYCLERHHHENMKNTFDPQIGSNDLYKAINNFEKLGFLKKHSEDLYEMDCNFERAVSDLLRFYVKKINEENFTNESRKELEIDPGEKQETLNKFFK